MISYGINFYLHRFSLLWRSLESEADILRADQQLLAAVDRMQDLHSCAASVS